MRSVEEALEIYFFSRLPPPMAEALEEDLRDLKIARENYFYSLLDARYRQLLAKPAARGSKGNAAKTARTDERRSTVGNR